MGHQVPAPQGERKIQQLQPPEEHGHDQQAGAEYGDGGLQGAEYYDGGEGPVLAGFIVDVGEECDEGLQEDARYDDEAPESHLLLDESEDGVAQAVLVLLASIYLDAPVQVRVEHECEHHAQSQLDRVLTPRLDVYVGEVLGILNWVDSRVVYSDQDALDYYAGET